MGDGLPDRGRMGQTRVSLRSGSDGREKTKGGAPVHGAFGSEDAASRMNDALHRGQANADAWKLILPAQPLEGLEKLVSVFHVEARAVCPPL